MWKLIFESALSDLIKNCDSDSIPISTPVKQKIRASIFASFHSHLRNCKELASSLIYMSRTNHSLVSDDYTMIPGLLFSAFAESTSDFDGQSLLRKSQSVNWKLWKLEISTHFHPCPQIFTELFFYWKSQLFSLPGRGRGDDNENQTEIRQILKNGLHVLPTIIQQLVTDSITTVPNVAFLGKCEKSLAAPFGMEYAYQRTHLHVPLSPIHLSIFPRFSKRQMTRKDISTIHPIMEQVIGHTLKMGPLAFIKSLLLKLETEPKDTYIQLAWLKFISKA